MSPGDEKGGTSRFKRGFLLRRRVIPEEERKPARKTDWREEQAKAGTAFEEASGVRHNLLRNAGRPKRPSFLEGVADRLGYAPPGVLPRAPRPIPPEVELPTDGSSDFRDPGRDRGFDEAEGPSDFRDPGRDRGFDEANGPPDFWDPERDGGFDEAEIRRGFPDYRELGVKPLPYEEWREPDPESWDDDSSRRGYAADVIAYYLPWHLGGNDYWGIYFRVPHMRRYIEWVERKLGQGNLAPLLVEQVFWHEMEHYEQELAATVLENVSDRILYPQWLDERHKIPVGLLNEKTGRWEEVHFVEEALATAREVEWAKRHEKKWGWPTRYSKFVEWNSKRLPTGYNRFYLCLGNNPRRMARTAFLESVRSIAGLSLPGYPDQKTANRLFSTPTERYDAVPVYHVYH